LRCYVHIGTGNYHVKTARLYADVGLFTCDALLTQMLLTSSTISPGTRLLHIAPRSWSHPRPCGRVCWN